MVTKLTQYESLTSVCVKFATSSWQYQ